MDSEFLSLIRPIIKTENYRSMRNFNHHNHISTYSHCLKVAYFAYKIGKKKKNIDMASLIRGALLHDYYLYDWHEYAKWHRFHGYKHPRFAYNNAVADYGNINKTEKDIILHHMFPLTIIPPHTKEGWIVSRADKMATHYDYKKAKERTLNKLKGK